MNTNALSCLLLLSICSVVVDSQDATKGTTLGQGIVTRVDVKQYADISLDIRDFRTHLLNGDSEAALELYEEGRNSAATADVKFTLKQMSTDLQKLAPKDRTPAFNFHFYGLADRDVTTSVLNEEALYADNFARPFISSKSQLAGDAVVALHSWMYATHLLYYGLHTCDLLSKADNHDLFNLSGGGMDEFIALWIGNDQPGGSAQGHGLYALAQRAGELFDTVRPGIQPEAPVNTIIKLLYNEGAVVLSFPDACSRDDDEDTVPALWSVAHRIISQMYVPLIQMLIDSLVRQDADAIRLYARAIVPQISQCRPSVYKRLKEALLDGTTTGRLDGIITDLQSVYDCLGITCQDVGSYQVDKVEQCDEIPVNKPLAEYVPSTRVHEHSKIDLDILQLGILTSLGSYTFAQMLYNYGRNSVNYRESDNDPYKVRSLMQMATSNARKAADPFYTYFVQYHNDPNYADKVVQETLERRGKWAMASPEQVKEVVIKTAAYQILYMNVLAELADAVQACKKGDMLTGEGGVHQWDEVAAFLVGSMEGAGEGGAGDLEDGQLMWNLANKRAFQFQTESKMGYSVINAELEDLLFAGRAEANALDCGNLERSTDRIQHLMLLPIIQSTIRYAIINEGLSSLSTNADLAEGETFALSVLPIIAQYDANSAALIQENMEVRAGQPMVRDGPQEVADAFYESLTEGFGYSCALVGAAPQADACAQQGGFSNVKLSRSGSATTSKTTVSVSILAVVLGLLMSG